MLHANSNTAPGHLTHNGQGAHVHAHAGVPAGAHNSRRSPEAAVFTVHPGLATPPSADVIAMPGTEQRTTIIPDTREPAVPVANLVPQAPEETVTYEIKRETATVTVPVSRASGTDGMFQALKASAVALEAQARNSGAIETSAIPMTPPPLPAPRVNETKPGEEDVIILGAEPEAWSEDDKAVMRRFAARAAEG